MIIILEGFDGTGKSTLAKQLSNELGFNATHPGKRPTTKDEIVSMTRDQVGLFTYAKHVNLIMDRCTPISSLCYNLGMPEGTQLQMTLSSLNKLTFKLIEMDDIVIVHCKNFFGEMIKSEHDDSTSLFFAEKNRVKIMHNYKTLLQSDRVIEFDGDNLDEVLVNIKSRLNSGLQTA